MINDLIGLNYQAGAKYFPGCLYIDCFALLCEVRRRLGLYDYENEFQWVYEQDKLPVKEIIKRMKVIAKPVEQPNNGDMVIMGGGKNSLAVGVVLNEGVLSISHGRKSFWTSSIPAGKFYSSLK